MTWFRKAKQPKQPPSLIQAYKYAPLPDVTVYELAKLMPLLVTDWKASREWYHAVISRYPPEVRRHFQVVEVDHIATDEAGVLRVYEKQR